MSRASTVKHGDERVIHCERATSGPFTLIKDHLAGGASRLAALLLPQILPVFSVVAPCHPGAALRDLVFVQRERATSRRAFSWVEPAPPPDWTVYPCRRRIASTRNRASSERVVAAPLPRARRDRQNRLSPWPPERPTRPCLQCAAAAEPRPHRTHRPASSGCLASGAGRSIPRVPCP